MDWSHYQLAVLDDFRQGVGHTVVEAVAGSGKTTVLVEGAISSPTHPILMCAFSKVIERELTKRVPQSIDVRTTHSLGLRMCAMRFSGVKVVASKGREIARAVCAEHAVDGYRGNGGYRGEGAPPHYKLERLVSLSKNLWANADDLGQIEGIASAADLDDEKVPPRLLAEMARSCLYRASEDTARVDFDDMIWFPIIFNIELRRWAHVIVDETQDLNKLQLQLLLQVLREGGRISVCGDRHQGIFGFRGADMDAMPHITSRLGAKKLPLSISYRCARRIGQEAQVYVPHFETRPDAPEGVVDLIGSLDLKRKVPDADCFVLSRRKAPLLPLCLKLLRSGKRAQIQGVDLGEDLQKLARSVRQKGDSDSIRLFEDRVKEHRSSELARLRSQDKQEHAEEVQDTTGALIALARDVKDVKELFSCLSAFFSDADRKDVITLSTVHKAKGLERERVFVLRDTFSRNNPEETNLNYVALTRAKGHLTYVQKDDRGEA
jgi:superfamily I DNA/RNA helicase